MVFVSSSCLKADNIMDSVAALSQITKNIELSGGTAYFDGDLTSNLKKLQSDGFNFLVHGYFPPPKEHFLLNFADTSDKTRDFVTTSALLCGKLGIEYYSTHAGFVSDFTIGKTENLTGGKESFGVDGIAQNIKWFFETFDGLGLALENLFPNHGDKGCCFWMRPECITDWLDKERRLSLLLDLGHLKISANAFGFDWINAAKTILQNYPDRIREIHLSENGGVFDEHLPVFEDSAQILILREYRTLIEDFKINVTLEARVSSQEDIQKSYELILQTLEG